MKFWLPFLLGIAIMGAAVAFGGCAGWLSGCTGPSDKLACTCGGQTNPACVAPLNDDMTKKPDSGTSKGNP